MTHEELRKLAEAATPGPWEWLSFTSRNSYFPIMAENQKIMVCDAGFGKAEKATNNSAYIAAANPQQVIALLDEIAQLRAEVEQSKRDAESFEFKAQRLRNVVNMLGLEDAAPYSDEDLLGCMGSVLGIVRREIEKIQGRLPDAANVSDAERFKFVMRKGFPELKKASLESDRRWGYSDTPWSEHHTIISAIDAAMSAEKGE